MKRMIAAVLCMATVLVYAPTSEAREYRLSKRAEKVMDIIVDETAKDYDKPWGGGDAAVCGMMGMQESGLGAVCRQNNLWGLGSGRYSYSSLREGIRAWLRCINNGHYGSAPGTKDIFSQLRKILDGGYCQPEGAYYSNCRRLNTMFNFEKYSKRMWRKIKKRRRKEKKLRQEKLRKKKLQSFFRVVYDPALAPHQVTMDSKILKKGTLQIGFGYFEVVENKKGIGNVMYVGTRQFGYVGRMIKIDKVFENAVG